MCFKKGCSDYRKSINREKVEGEFEDLLSGIRPTKAVMDMADTMFKTLWEKKANSQQQDRMLFKRELQQTEKQIEGLLDRMVDAQSETVMLAFERKVKSLEENKLILNEKIARCGSALPDYDETFRTALKFIEDPQKLWHSGRLEDRQNTLKMVFSGALEYDRNKGFRTASFSLPFKTLAALKGGNFDMAESEGFEPPDL